MEDKRNGMLTLAHHEGESLILTIEGMQPIRIILATIDKKRQQARIAIDAAEEVEVWREELLDEETK
jgi:sRNA-binding carbon storage regulator CsrA